MDDQFRENNTSDSVIVAKLIFEKETIVM